MCNRGFERYGDLTPTDFQNQFNSFGVIDLPFHSAYYGQLHDPTVSLRRSVMNSEAVRGMTTGATVMFFFGAIWLMLGLYAGRASPISVRVGLLLAGIVLAAGIG